MMWLPTDKTETCLICFCLYVVRCAMNLERKREDTEDLLGVWLRRSKRKYQGILFSFISNTIENMEMDSQQKKMTPL